MFKYGLNVKKIQNLLNDYISVRFFPKCTYNSYNKKSFSKKNLQELLRIILQILVDTDFWFRPQKIFAEIFQKFGQHFLGLDQNSYPLIVSAELSQVTLAKKIENYLLYHYSRKNRSRTKFCWLTTVPFGKRANWGIAVFMQFWSFWTLNQYLSIYWATNGREYVIQYYLPNKLGPVQNYWYLAKLQALAPTCGHKFLAVTRPFLGQSGWNF